MVEYSDCISAEEKDLPPPTDALDMTVNHLMVRPPSWSFGNVEKPFSYYNQVHSIRVPSMVPWNIKIHKLISSFLLINQH